MTRKLQEQNHTKIETKLVSIIRCFRKNKTIPSGSVVPEVIHRSKMVLSAYELVVILGVLRTSCLVQEGGYWGKKQLGGKRTFEGRGRQVVTAQISWWWGSPRATVGLGGGHTNPTYWLGEEKVPGKQKCPAVLPVSCRLSK